MEGKLIKILLFCATLILFNGTAYGLWDGPSEILRAPWGNEDGEVGREYQYLGWEFPWVSAVLYDDRLMITDSVNNRVVFYRPGGTVEKFMPFYIEKDGNKVINLDCYIHGVMAYTPEGIWDSCGDLYCLRDPIEGTIKERRTNYPLETDASIYKKYSGIILRDRNDFRYIVEQYYNSDDNATCCWGCYRVRKFNSCSKEVSVFDLPESRYEALKPGEEDLPPKPIIEYSEPFVSYKGDVYCGVYQESHYGVLKWTWKDGPDDQNPGPDPPGNLYAVSAPSGVKLTWTASAQDPGCVTGYEIARSTDPSGTYSTIDSAGAGVFAYEDGTAAKNVTYYYKVRAVAGDLYSEYTVSVRIPQG